MSRAGLDEVSSGDTVVAEAYDPFHEPLLSDPYPFFARARDEAPIFHASEIDH